MSHAAGEPAPTFSFGENWASFLSQADAAAFVRARADIIAWLGEDGVHGKRVLDLGCGSGIHSSCLHALGARELVSVDLDPASVTTARSLWQSAGTPASWRVLQGSALDSGFLAGLGTFDLVYSWGVLHHTGALWQALDHAADATGPGGRLWVTIYTSGPLYPRHLALKQRYNRAGALGKWWLERTHILRCMLGRLRRRQNPFTWNQAKDRGMDTWHDLIDWLGGLPYEVASADEMVRWGRRHGFTLEWIDTAAEGSCSGYVFARV
jgi:2-polyprenyl-6-hydroxyphenyl methylase/3-demethylubiquinone-9 3-methyltransferase